MTGFFIAIGVALAVAVVVSLRHDRRQRGLRSGSVSGRALRRARRDNQTRAHGWGSPG